MPGQEEKTMNSRIYGNDPTKLKLTRLARKMYQLTDPLIITEYDTDEGIRYDIEGCVHRFYLTAEEVNETLEGLVYEM